MTGRKQIILIILIVFAAGACGHKGPPRPPKESFLALDYTTMKAKKNPYSGSLY
jgi:predicted small lipoprotein YifL